MVVLVGLQGSGKTTSCGKLGTFLRERGFFPLLVSTDTRRPAAKEQLRILAQGSKLEFFDTPSGLTPLEVVRASRTYAREKGLDVVLVDTAGRLHVEEDLLRELKELVTQETLQEVLLVLDATTRRISGMGATYRDDSDQGGHRCPGRGSPFHRSADRVAGEVCGGGRKGYPA
jgi:signal recognition particle subunit SRP54